MRRHVFDATRFWERCAQFTRAALHCGSPEAPGTTARQVDERWTAWLDGVRLWDRDLFDGSDRRFDEQVIRYLFGGAVAQQVESGAHVVILEES